MDLNSSPERGGIVERIKAILLKPKETWPVIDRETESSGDLFTRYAVPLAAIGPAASFLGGQLLGYGTFWFSYRPSFFGALTGALGSYVLSLVGLLVMAFIVNMLAPKFGGEASPRSAFKLVTYSATAGWLVGIFSLIPSLGFLGLLGLYGLYLFYTGAKPLMKVPDDKIMSFTITTVVGGIILAVIAGSVAGAVGSIFGGGRLALFGGSPSHDDLTINVPGAGMTVDTRKLEQASKDMEQAFKSGNGKAVAPAALQALLPTTIGAYKRTAVESMQAGPAGSRAEGTYEAGDKSFKLSVADMSAVGAIAGIGAALGVEQNREDADGYEHTTTTDGVLVSEKWHKSGDGSFGTMVGKRFFVQAEGEANNIDELKGAVASVDPGRLVALAQ